MTNWQIVSYSRKGMRARVLQVRYIRHGEIGR